MVTASGGAWNASVFAEYTHLPGRNIDDDWTGGIGYSDGDRNGRFPILLLATILISLIVVSMNRLVWRRLYRFGGDTVQIGWIERCAHDSCGVGWVWIGGRVFHAPLITSVEGMELIAVVSGKRMLQQSGIAEIKTYRSIEELFADSSIQLIVITTPSGYALRTGKVGA